MIIDNADRALETACRETGAVIAEYTAGPVFMSTGSRGYHEWIIEFARKPADPEAFIDSLDKALKSVNSDYEAKRHADLNLGRPICHSVPPGTFNKWLMMKNKFGGQNKVPRLSNSREYIEDLYVIAGIEGKKD